MPIEVGIWRLGEMVQKIAFSSLDSEARLEDTLAKDISILSPNLMLIGRQVATDYGKFIDLLAMNADGDLTVIELKRGRTPREVVAQILDYASWVQDLSYEKLSDIYSEKNNGKKFEEGFADVFDSNPPEKLNQSLELVVVATELDSSTERIINYLSDNYGVPLNAVFFRHFQDGDNRYLTRSWLIDPQEAEAKASKAPQRKGSEPWNGRDFYVSIGEGETRTWEDCRKYGFVCGGGGKWYSQTLDKLSPGARVFANIPKVGYVGVGTVIGKSTPVTEFKVNVDGKEIPILQADLKASNLAKHAEPEKPECWEYFVPVKWIKAVPKEEKYWEKGLFASQHTACKLRNRFTLERLSQHFHLED